VGVTEARDMRFDERLHLTGTVRSQRYSVVAAEVDGLVERLHVREGDFVRRGAPLATLRREVLQLDLEAKSAELREAEARLDLARQNLERARDLFESGVTSRQDLDAAVSESTAWRGRVDRLQAEIARARDDLARSAIPAPFSGFVIRERTQVGEWLAVGAPVVEMIDLEEPEILLEVPERHFAALRVGSAAAISFEALPGLRIDGRVTAVIPAADPQARTFPVKVRFPNRDHRVGAGMLARVELSLGKPGPGLAVPKDALLSDGQGVTVLVVGSDDTVRTAEVRTRRAAGQWVEIEGDVRPGDRVITRGNERVRPGQVVSASVVEYPLP
jgi:RND family efflux transporter MFP subunit